MTGHGSRAPRLRVAQLIETLGTGGAERLAVQIANARAAAGNVSHLYVLAGPGELSARVQSGVRVRHLELPRAPISRPLAFGRSVWSGHGRLRRQLAGDGIEVLQTHLPAANFWGLAMALSRAACVIPTVHSTNEARYGDDGSFKAGLRRRAYRLLLERCSAVVCVAPDVRESLLAFAMPSPRAARRAVVVANGVVIPERFDAHLVAKTRAQFGIPAGDRLVLAAGRLVEVKNFGLLIEATAHLRARGVRCRVLIAGHGPLRASLERRAEELGLEDQVHFAGLVSNLDELMQGADVFVLPSLWEGLPLTLLEAMAAGLPVIGTRVRGISEIIEEGRNGLLVAPTDPRELAGAIAALLADPARRALMGAASREIAVRDYDFERVNRELGELYASVMRSAVSGGNA